jgi:hypothetical protein
MAEMSASPVFGLALGVSNKTLNLEQPFSYSTAAAPPQVFRHRFCGSRPSCFDRDYVCSHISGLNLLPALTCGIES